MSVIQQVVKGRTGRAVFVMLLSLAAYTALDLGTKEWALDNLSHVRAEEPPPVCESDAHGYIHMQRVPRSPMTVIPGRFNLQYAENCGAAFGVLRTAPKWLRASIFGALTLAACVWLSLAFVRGAGGPLFAAAVPLILSGAIGNIVDRVRHGFVVDFLHVDPAWFNYPTFNVADIAILVGFVLFFLDGTRRLSADESSSPSALADSARDSL